ncbi:MAG: hypothetical protein ACO3RB_08455 [Ilumatobacteraceae bacterium]
MRGLLASIRRSPMPAALVAYAVVRAAGIIGRPAGRFPDSDGWLILTWWGDNTRLWPVPALLTLAGSDAARIALQFVLGTVAWTFLAVTLAGTSRFPRAIGLATLAVGLTPQVTRWDLAILSESLGITFVVAATASTVRLVRGTGGLVPWIIAVSLVGLTRPTHVVVLAAIAAASIAVAVRSRGARLVIPALVFAAAAVWAVALVNGNAATSRLNIYTVLANDVAPFDERWSWFVARGMPDVPGARDATGYDFAGALPDDVAAIVDLPVGQQPPALVRAGGAALAEWVREAGVSTLTRWIATHPADVLSTVADRADATLSPPNDDFLPLETRDVWPRILFGAWQVWVVAWGAALVVATLRGRAGREVRAIAAMAVAVAAVHVVTMSYSGIEHQRHAATTAAAVRVVALSSLALALPRRASGRPTDDDVSGDGTPRGGRDART